MFSVPRAGTWTVSCANGIQSRSQNVSISYTGQAASVTLSYIQYLFKAGTGALVNIRSYTQQYASVTLSANSIAISRTSGEKCGAIVITDWIDLNSFKKLVIECNLTDVWIGYYGASTGITTTNITSYGDIQSYVAKGAVTATGSQKISIDISSLSGGYFGFGNFAYGEISNIWLEPA